MVDRRRTSEHGYTISSPCEPDSSGELIHRFLHDTAHITALDLEMNTLLLLSNLHSQVITGNMKHPYYLIQLSIM